MNYFFERLHWKKCWNINLVTLYHNEDLESLLSATLGDYCVTQFVSPMIWLHFRWLKIFKLEKCIRFLVTNSLDTQIRSLKFLKIIISGFFKSWLIINRKRSANYNEENWTDFVEVIIKYFLNDIQILDECLNLDFCFEFFYSNWHLQFFAVE